MESVAAKYPNSAECPSERVRRFHVGRTSMCLGVRSSRGPTTESDGTSRLLTSSPRNWKRCQSAPPCRRRPRCGGSRPARRIWKERWYRPRPPFRLGLTDMSLLEITPKGSYC